MTRTTLVALSELFSILAAAARGKPDGRVHSAISVSRVRTLVRRSSAYVPDVLSFGGTTLDASAYILRADGGEVRLNNKEFQLMELFLRHPRQIFSAERLMDKIWGLDSDAEIDVVWTYIGFLRKKLREIGSNAEIRTIRGAGYTLEETSC